MISRPLIGIALVLMALGCVDQTPGIEIPLEARLEVGATTTNDMGYEITVESGHMTFSTADIVACGEGGVLNEWLTTIWPVQVAHAHTPTSPLGLGTPVVLDLVADRGSAVMLGALTPPPARYCELWIGFLPTDTDALRLPDEGMVGQTLRLRGTWRAPGDTDTRPFIVEGFATETIFLALKAQDGGIDMTRPGVGTRLVLGLDGATLFSGVDFEAMAPDEVADLVLDNAISTLRVAAED